MKFLYLFCLLVFLSACKKNDSEISPQLHTDYFPLKKGQFVIYETTQITHDENVSQHDTLRYWLKTIVGQLYVDNEGRAAHEFLRFVSNDLGFSWQIQDVWTAILDGNRLELVEENERVIKLLFAPTFSKEWNLNAYNSKPYQVAVYSKIHEPFTLNNNFFDSTITVKQADLFSFVDFREQSEVYAKGIGLVSKYYKNLEIDNFDTLNVQKGTELYYNCISFGFE